MTTMVCLPARLSSRLAGAGGFLVGHARGGLIDQQQLGILREQHADLQPLLLAVGERAGFPIALRDEIDGLEDTVDAVALRAA